MDDLKPADWQTSQFYGAGGNWYRVSGERQPGRMEGDGDPRPACWLWAYDVEQDGEDERDCDGRLEKFHFVGRQRIRNALSPLLVPPGDVASPAACIAWVDDLVSLAQWDPRNAGEACTVHHRAYDNHVASGLKIPAAAVPLHTLYFALHWGLEDELQKHCRDDLAPVIADRIPDPDPRYT